LYKIHLMTSKGWKFRHKLAKEQLDVSEFDGWKDSEYIKHILELRREISELEQVLEKSTEKKKAGSESASERKLSEKDFKQEWSYPTKIAFLITLQNRPVVSAELDSLLRKLDEHYANWKNPKLTLATTLTRCIKTGRIKKIKLPGVRELLFVLPEWVDANGNLLPFYKNQIRVF
jgi:hypothetical protein